MAARSPAGTGRRRSSVGVDRPSGRRRREDPACRSTWTCTPSPAASAWTTSRRRTRPTCRRRARTTCSYLRYWVDEAAGKIFCLVEAPNPEAAHSVHREAHGLVADELYEVIEGS